MELRVEIVKCTNIFGNFANTFLMTKWIGKVGKTIGEISVTIWLKHNPEFHVSPVNFLLSIAFFPLLSRAICVEGWGLSLHIIYHQGAEGSRRASGLSGDLGSLLTSVSLSGPWACGAVMCFWYPYSLPGCWSQCKPLSSSPSSHLSGPLFSSAFSKLWTLSMPFGCRGEGSGLLRNSLLLFQPQ